MRQLKFHEKKLLKKVDFVDWKDNNLREIKVMRRYHIQNREDYQKYFVWVAFACWSNFVEGITKLLA